jgi:hypothetical protein
MKPRERPVRSRLVLTRERIRVQTGVRAGPYTLTRDMTWHDSDEP